MYTYGDKIWVPHPDRDGRHRASFLEPGDPGEGIEVDGQRRDIAWVLYEGGDRDGTFGSSILADIRPRVDMCDRRQTPILESRIRFEMPDALVLTGAESEGAVLRAALESEDFVERLGRGALPVAKVLERLFISGDLIFRRAYALDLATALRLECESGARRGEPLDWHEDDGGNLHATGTQWWLENPGSAGGRWGVGTRGFDPDWWAGSKEAAKAVAEEIAVRPKFT